MKTDMGRDEGVVTIDRLNIRIEWEGYLYPLSDLLRILSNVRDERDRLAEECKKLRNEREELLREFAKRDKVIAERDKRIAELERLLCRTTKRKKRGV